MKKTLLIFLFLFFSQWSFSQTKIDELISINFPGKVVKVDTTANGIKVLNYYSNVGDAIFMVQKIRIDSLQNEQNVLPSDLNGLNELYSGFIIGVNNSIGEKGFIFKESNSKEISGFHAYTASYTDSITGLKNAEMEIFFLNEHMYALTYLNTKHFDVKESSTFFNSLQIQTAQNPSQLTIRPRSVQIAYKIGRIMGYILLLGIVIFLFRLFFRKFR